MEVVGEAGLAAGAVSGIAHAGQALLDRLELAEEGVRAAGRVAEAGIDGVHLVGQRFHRPLHFVHFRQLRVDGR